MSQTDDPGRVDGSVLWGQTDCPSYNLTLSHDSIYLIILDWFSNREALIQHSLYRSFLSEFSEDICNRYRHAQTRSYWWCDQLILVVLLDASTCVYLLERLGNSDISISVRVKAQIKLAL